MNEASTAAMRIEEQIARFGASPPGTILERGSVVPRLALIDQTGAATSA